jgi:cyanate permease
METLNVQILKTMGRWSVVLLLLCSQAANAQESIAWHAGESIWHNALFIFSICFFIAGFVFLLMMKAREDQKSKMRDLRHKHHFRH